MKTKRPVHRLLYPLLAALLAASCAPIVPVKRVAMVTQLRPEKLAEYKRLHADSNPGVRDLLSKYHMRNFSIYLQKIDGKWYEFGYYEYTGNNFDADMATMAKEHNNANILVLGGRVIDAAAARAMVTAWLDTEFAGGRHQARLDKITALESELKLQAV